MAYLEMKESCEFIFHLQVSAGCGTQYQQLSLHSQLPLTSAVLDHFTKYAKKIETTESLPLLTLAISSAI